MFTKADTQRRLHVIRLSFHCGSFTKHSHKELSLIGFNEEQKMHTLFQTTQQLRQKYGLDILKYGIEL
jgi:DNA polymerase-4